MTKTDKPDASVEEKPEQTPEVLGELGEDGGGGAAKPDKPDKPETPAAELRRLQTRLQKLEEGLEAANTAAIHWHDQYQTAVSGRNGGAKTGADADGEEPASEADQDDLIEVITSGGPKALAKTLRKLGFMTQDEFERKADARIKAASGERELRERYPELDDNESDMFKETGRQFRLLEDAGLSKADRLTLAAEKAELSLRRQGKWVDRNAEKEERAARARAQGGGHKGGSDADDSGDDSLTPHQKKMVEQMGITEESYKKRAKEGVLFSGLRR